MDIPYKHCLFFIIIIELAGDFQDQQLFLSHPNGPDFSYGPDGHPPSGLFLGAVRIRHYLILKDNICLKKRVDEVDIQKKEEKSSQLKGEK